MARRIDERSARAEIAPLFEPPSQTLAGEKQLIIEKILRWIIFGLTLSLLPILLSAIVQDLSGASFSFSNLVGRGELLIISSSLCMTALGEFLFGGKSTNYRIGKSFVFGMVIVFGLMSGFTFAAISADGLSQNPQFSAGAIVRVSFSLFVPSVLFALSCVIYSEV